MDIMREYRSPEMEVNEEWLEAILCISNDVDIEDYTETTLPW